MGRGYRLSVCPRNFAFRRTQLGVVVSNVVFGGQIASGRIVGKPYAISLPEDRPSTSYHPDFLQKPTWDITVQGPPPTRLPRRAGFQ